MYSRMHEKNITKRAHTDNDKSRDRFCTSSNERFRLHENSWSFLLFLNEFMGWENNKYFFRSNC